MLTKNIKGRLNYVLNHIPYLLCIAGNSFFEIIIVHVVITLIFQNLSHSLEFLSIILDILKPSLTYPSSKYNKDFKSDDFTNI
jgi:hypothetical protein